MTTLVRALVALALAATVLAATPAHAVAGDGPDPVVVTGRVTDGTGAPVPGVGIIAELAAEQWVEVGLTDADGAYRAELDLRDQRGPVYVGVELLGDLRYYGSAVVGDGHGPYPPGTVYPLDLVVPDVAHVSGTVRDASEEPVPGAEVYLTDLEVREEGAVTTDDAGRYDARVLAGSSYHVQVVADGFEVLDQDVELLPGPQVLDWTLTPAVPEPAPQPAPAADRPGRPRVAAVRSVGPRRAVVRFRRPAAGGRPEVFQAQCFHRGAVRRSARDTTSPVVVARLKPGKAYRCRVRARNDAGWSPYSSLSRTFRTPARRR